MRWHWGAYGVAEARVCAYLHSSPRCSGTLVQIFCMHITIRLADALLQLIHNVVCMVHCNVSFQSRQLNPVHFFCKLLLADNTALSSVAVTALTAGG